MRTDIADRKSDILIWILENRSKAYMCKALRCKPSTLNSWLRKLGLVYNGNRGLRGWKNSPKRKTFQEYVGTCEVPSSTRVRKKLIEDGLKNEACERCRLIKWLDAKIPLELHHKDGNRFNNEIDNLEVLCPNCHALEPNNSGAANKGNTYPSEGNWHTSYA